MQLVRWPKLTEHVIAEHHLNSRDFLRVEICDRRGKLVTRISRWKTSASKVHRTGDSFEFAARHIDDLIAALALAGTTAQRLAASQIDGRAA
jgi:hypothetical protein